MSNLFYKEKPLYKRTYLFPVFLLPILIGITRSTKIVPLFTILSSVFLWLLTCWSYRIRILFTMYNSNHPVYILYKEKLCKVKNMVFECDKTTYLIKDKEVHRLTPIVQRSYKYYKDGFKSEQFVEPDLLKHYNKNYFNIEPPKFAKLFSQHAVSPFFVFQIFCGILWCLDEYIYQALFTIFMLIVIEAGLVLQRIINMKQFRTMNHKSFNVGLVGKSGEKNFVEESVSSIDLLPGDIIKIKECIRIPCDLLLMRGSCAVNEAMLSGESIPLSKEDIKEIDNERVFDMDKDKKHILFAGTDLVKIESSYLECFVLYTGFDTQQGELIKKMMCNEEVSVNDAEAFGFIGCLLFFAIVAACYTWREGLKMGKTSYKIFLEVILIITNVVPTELPLELSMAVNSCVKSLMDLGIFCLEPFRIPIAGKVNVCCFDKTGTLTETVMEVSDIKHTNKFTVDILKTCHSLINIDDKLTGDPLETGTYDYINKIVLASNNYKCKASNISLDDEVFVKSVNETLMSKYITLKKYLFSSENKRMTVVYEVNRSTYVSMKGAPEMIVNYLESVPEYYKDYEEYAKNGYRVIALAYKPYRKQAYYDRNHVEKNMIFSGFLLFDCKLKENARETVHDLRNSGHKVIMITGDNILTALSVAKKLGMENKGIEGSEIDGILDKKEFEDISVFARADPSHKEKIIEKYNRMGKYTLMCGDGTNDVGALKKAHIGVALVEPQVKTKNVSNDEVDDEKHQTPQQKLLKKLASDLNETSVKMGDASVAAPFTSKSGTLESILHIIRQGRSALVTTIQMYKILALNSLVNAFSLSVLDCMGIRFGEYQLVASGILVAFAFMFLTKNTPLKEISKKRPLTTIFNKYIILSVISQVLVHIASYLVVIKKVKSIETLEYQEKFSPSLSNTALFFLGTAQQLSTFLVNYIGRPFRESLVENKKLSACLVCLLGFIFYLMFDFNEEFSKLMEVVPLGDIKYFMCYVITCDILLCFVLEKICFYFFML